MLAMLGRLMMLFLFSIMETAPLTARVITATTTMRRIVFFCRLRTAVMDQRGLPSI
jgi:hypothetical protein